MKTAKDKLRWEALRLRELAADLHGLLIDPCLSASVKYHYAVMFEDLQDTAKRVEEMAEGLPPMVR